MEPLTPQEQAWTDELDREGWSYADIMRQRDEARAEVEERLAADLLVQQRATDEAETALDRANRLLRYVLHLRMYGENAPGGNETWQQFDRDCDEYLRSVEGES